MVSLRISVGFWFVFGARPRPPIHSSTIRAWSDRTAPWTPPPKARHASNARTLPFHTQAFRRRLPWFVHSQVFAAARRGAVARACSPELHIPRTAITVEAIDARIEGRCVRARENFARWLCAVVRSVQSNRRRRESKRYQSSVYLRGESLGFVRIPRRHRILHAIPVRPFRRSFLYGAEASLGFLSKIASILVVSWAYPNVACYRFDFPESHPFEDGTFRSNLPYCFGYSPVGSTHPLWIALGSTPGLLIGRLLCTAPNHPEISIARRDLRQDCDGDARGVDQAPLPAELTAKKGGVYVRSPRTCWPSAVQSTCQSTRFTTRSGSKRANCASWRRAEGCSWPWSWPACA